MRVLVIPSEHFVTQGSPLGGIFQYEQAKALSKSGHNVGVISSGFISLRHLGRAYPYEKRENTETLIIFRKYRRSFFLERFIPPAINVARYLKLFEKLYRDYEEEFGKPDVVHAHNFFYAGFMAEWLYKTRDIPYVLTEHSSAFARGLVSAACDRLLRRVADSAGELTCVSGPLKVLLCSRIKRSFGLLQNLVDASFFDGSLERSVNPVPFIFLTVGSLDLNKNQALLLRAFAGEYKQSTAVLKVIGDGPLRIELQKLATTLGIANQVCFLGQISRERVRDEMLSAHCFVLPSNYETFGVVLIEALACGLPLIATRSGGPEDIVNPGNGLLIDVGSERQLINAMRFIRQNSAKYDRQQLRDEARSKFGAEAFVKNAVSLYEKAIYGDRSH